MPAPSYSSIAVLGIGNVLLGDEGIGVHALRAFAERSDDLAGLIFIDGGTLGLALMPEIEDCAGLIVLDAAELRAPAGEVAVFEGASMDAFLEGRRKGSVHEIGLADLLAMAALRGRLPPRRALIAIQPAMIGWNDAPTAPVAAAIPDVCAQARGLIEGWRQ